MRIAFVGNFSVGYSSESHHAKSLESLGHEVVRLQEGSATGDQIQVAAAQSDMLVFVHTHGWVTPGTPIERVLSELNSRRIPTVTYHLDLWMGLRRHHDLDSDPFYRSIGWFFTVDKRMADWFCENTAVKGRYLPAGVFADECYISDEPSPHANDVIFVGSRGYHSEWPYRPQLIDWLRKTYGSRFTHAGPDGDTGTVRGDDLNRLYANSKVAVGDTLCIDFDYPWYWSDRATETMGRGGFLIHPHIAGMEWYFKGDEHLAYYRYGDFDQLKNLIDHYLQADDERERIRDAGHRHVKAHHTYVNRWQEILDTVFA